MDQSLKAILYSVGNRIFNYSLSLLTTPRHNSVETRIQHIDRLIEAIPAGEFIGIPATAPVSQEDELLPATVSQTSPEENQTAEIATACVACAVGHFSTSSGLLKEAVRFKGEGMTSNEILDRIAAVLEEQNSLERVDLAPEKIQRLSEWLKAIAEEALVQSRQLRHRLESIQSVDELEQAAIDTKKYYIKLNRQWFKGRFTYLGASKAEAIAQRVEEK